MRLCQRFCMEFQRPMFGLNENPIGLLDIRESFHMGEGLFSWVGLVKLVVLAIIVAAFVHAFIQFPIATWYPAYLTTWGVFFCILYLTGSLLLTSCSTKSTDQQDINSFGKIRYLLKFTWVTFSLAVVMECSVVVLYWTFDFDPERDTINLNNLNVHGICMIITLLHGFLVDRVPVRIKHFLFTFLAGCLFCGWLAIQNVVLKYNPMDDDDDDALYDILKWRENTTSAIILSVAVLFGGFPFFTILLWLLSLPGRLYLEILEEGAEGVVLDYDKAIAKVEQDEVARC